MKELGQFQRDESANLTTVEKKCTYDGRFETKNGQTLAMSRIGKSRDIEADIPKDRGYTST